MRRHSDSSPLTHTDPLQGFVNASNHIAQANKRVVSAVSRITKDVFEKKIVLKLVKYTKFDVLAISWNINELHFDNGNTCNTLCYMKPYLFQMTDWPGIEDSAVLKGSIIMVTYEISHHCPSPAWLWDLLNLHFHIILHVKHVHQ